MGYMNERRAKTKSGDDVILRSATQDDAFKIAALATEVFNTSDYLITTPEEFSAQGKEHQRERIKRYEEDENWLLLVVQHNDQLVGMLDFQNGKKRRIAHKGAFGMSVQSSWRGKGIGKILLSGLIEWATKNPTIEVICLGVIEDNRSAVSLYSRMGFEVTGREPYGVKLADGRFLADLSMSLRLEKPTESPNIKPESP